MLKKFTTLWFQGTKRSWCRYFCVVNLRGSNFMPYACKPKDTFTNIGFFLWLIVLRDVRNVCRSILFKNIFAILLILWLLLEKLKIMKTILLDFINNDIYQNIWFHSYFSMYVNKFIPSSSRFQCLETPYSNVCNAQNILHGVYFENLLHSCLQFTALWCIMRKELIVVITYFIAEKLKCTFVTNSEFRISMTRNLHEIWKNKNWTTKRSKIFVICTYTY